MESKKQATPFIKEDQIKKGEVKRQFVNRVYRVDAKNTVTKYVEVTPSVCMEPNCTFDAAPNIAHKKIKYNDFGNLEFMPSWHDLNEDEREAALELLALHKKERHKAVNTHIVDEDELAAIMNS